jgi:hypothetical protein
MKYAKPGTKLYKFIQWLQEIKGGASLPEHLEFKLHNDWPPGLRWVPRELTAFGRRSKVWWANWRRFPILLIGYNCTRWMDKNNLEVTVCPGKGWLYLKGYNDCGPSPIQKWEESSFQISWPLHISYHCKLWKDVVFYVIVSYGKMLYSMYEL